MVAKLARLPFWCAVLVTLWFAWTPEPPAILPSDKAEHGLAFVVLVPLLVLAYPRLGWITVAAILAAFGALIEIVQGIPGIHRDADIHDWIADVIAIVVALAAVRFARWIAARHRRRA
ncbi:MAG: hypothetical protein ACM3YM_07545 [Sphingomonadales bacterium]